MLICIAPNGSRLEPSRRACQGDSNECKEVRCFPEPKIFDHFFEGSLSGNAETSTLPEPGSISQNNVEPCSIPRIAATGSGTVVRTEDERGKTRTTFDLNTLDNETPITPTSGSLYSFGLDVGLTVRQRHKYEDKYIGLQISQHWKERFMELNSNLRQKGSRLLSLFPDAVKHKDSGKFQVRSETGYGSYQVEDQIDKWVCECRYFKEESEVCKHIAAVWLLLDRMTGTEIEIEETKPKTQSKQNWSAYTAAQIAELRLFDPLLWELVRDIADPAEPQTRDRPRTGFPLQLFCAIRKVASMYGCRKSYEFFDTARKKGLLDFAPNYAVPSRILNRSDLTPVLEDLVSAAALPLSAVEDYITVAVDSSGFRTNSYGFYRQEKYGSSRKNIWLKTSILIGCRTHAILRAAVTGNDIGDAPLFPLLVKGAIGAGFEIGEATADKGYLSRENYNLGPELGINVFIPFKVDSTSKSKGSAEWKKKYHMFHLKRDEFDSHYHRRSNVESVFSAMKTRFGETLKSKNRTAQINEAYCKIIAYNIAVQIHEMFEHGVDIHVIPPDIDNHGPPKPEKSFLGIATQRKDLL